MTNEKAKEILAQGNKYLQEGKSVINDLKFRATKTTKGKKDVIDNWALKVENLYNYALVQEIRVEERDVELARRSITIYEKNCQIKELQRRIEVMEKMETF